MSRILVADDDPDIVALVRVTLERAGHAVTIAPDGEAAWEAFRADVPDLAILDVMMPRLDGLELTRRIRADPAGADVPLIVVSAAVQESARRAAVEAGADLHVRKPFSPRELRATVDRLLDQRVSPGSGRQR